MVPQALECIDSLGGGGLHILVQLPPSESIHSSTCVIAAAYHWHLSPVEKYKPMATGDVGSFLCNSPLTCPHRSLPTILHSSYPSSLAAVSPPPNDSCGSLIVQF